MQETQVPSLGREDSPGEGNGNPVQYSCLKNPMDGGTWWATVLGVAKSWTQLSEFHSFISLIYHSTFPVIGIVNSLFMELK